MDGCKDSRFNNWQTVRYELLNTRISDLGLRIEGGRLEPLVLHLYGELAAKKLKFRPAVYLTDTWGCPDRVPLIGIPFFLADERLMRIEEEQTGDVEDVRKTMMFLRHEAAHAFNYAYKLWEFPEWDEVFGSFDLPYREVFKPRPASRNFVRHLYVEEYGRSYAQKHPDEDFAETFAVWLTPRSGWRRKYRFWPVIEKLNCVDRWICDVRNKPPARTTGQILNPVERMNILLVDHYGASAEQYRAAAQGYLDDRLREVFPRISRGRTLALNSLLKKHRQRLADRLRSMSGLLDLEVTAILDKLEERSQALKVKVFEEQVEAGLVDAAALASALAMEFAFTGRLAR